MSRSITLLIARHGLATGNEKEAPLSALGRDQARQLADSLAGMENLNFEIFLTSPYARASETAKIIEDRLSSPSPKADERLKEQGVPGFGPEETDEEVLRRAVSLVEDLLDSPAKTALLVTHRLTMTLLMHHYDPDFTIEQGRSITNPDLYELKISGSGGHVTRLWNPEHQAAEPAHI